MWVCLCLFILRIQEVDQAAPPEAQLGYGHQSFAWQEAGKLE